MEVYIIKDSKKSVDFNNIPEYAITYLAYGDASGLEEKDVKNIDEWNRKNNIDHLVDCKEGRYFSTYPEFGLPSYCVDANFLVNEKEVVRKENLNLVPEFTNNTWRTEDEIRQWNNAGFHWNGDEDRWETDSDNFDWWKELADARHEAYSVFEDPGEPVNTEGRNGRYGDFIGWFRENIEGNELEKEKELFPYILDFAQAIRDGEVFRDEDNLDRIANDIEKSYAKVVAE